MIQAILSFLVVFLVFYFGIGAVRATTGKEKLRLTKILGYSIICAVLTLTVLFFIVVLF
jgi:hypothetical protein